MSQQTMNQKTISKEEARGQKSRAGARTKTWVYAGRFTDAEAAAEYVNAEPAQGAGEVSLTVHDDATVDVFAYL